MWSPAKETLTFGCSTSACAAVLARISLTPILVSDSFSELLSSARRSRTRPMSISTVRKKWGIGPRLCTRLRAMAFRVWLSSTRSYGVSGPIATVSSAAVTPSRIAASMSRLMIRPPGPLPCSRCSGMPLSRAMRRASGDALTRSPSPSPARPVATGGFAGSGATVFSAAGVSAVALSAAWEVSVAACSAVGPAAATPPAASASARMSEMSSSSGATTARSVPVGTVLFSSTRILRSTPVPIASTSMVALSVSTSTTTSPDSTGSPSFLTQLMIRPSSMVGDSFDITMRVAISTPGNRPGGRL